MEELPLLYTLKKIANLYTSKCSLLPEICSKIFIFSVQFAFLDFSWIRVIVLGRPDAACTLTKSCAHSDEENRNIENLSDFFKDFRLFQNVKKIFGLFICNDFHLCSFTQIKIFLFLKSFCFCCKELMKDWSRKCETVVGVEVQKLPCQNSPYRKLFSFLHHSVEIHIGCTKVIGGTVECRVSFFQASNYPAYCFINPFTHSFSDILIPIHSFFHFLSL